MSKPEKQLIELLNSVDPKQLAQIDVPDEFKHLIQARKQGEKFKELDRFELKEVEKALLIKAKEDSQEQWKKQMQNEL